MDENYDRFFLGDKVVNLRAGKAGFRYSLLNAFPGEETTRVYALSLMDDEAVIRHTAAESLNVPDVKRQVKLIAPLLYDPVKAVRTQAASMLAGEPAKDKTPPGPDRNCK